MSKIICDVCGTSYQDSALQCPICGCARPVDVLPKIASDDVKVDRRENYTYVKGGRFSKANVQKRHNGMLPENRENATSSDVPAKTNNNKSDKGLVIAVCALLLAIIAVVIYIAIHFFSDADSGKNDQPVMQETTTQSTETTPYATDAEISCAGIVLSQSEITLTFAGEERTLSIILTPDDTTDKLLFATSDSTIATISDTGNLVAVSGGEAIITVTCGDASAQCRVICSFDEAPTDAPTTPTVGLSTYTAPYKINKTDVSISVGETFLLKLSDANGEIVPITWSPAVSDICSIDGNSITGVMKGKVEISATYEGETYTCIVRVR